MKSVNENTKATVAKNVNKKISIIGKSIRVRPQNPFKLIDCEKFSPVPSNSLLSLSSNAVLADNGSLTSSCSQQSIGNRVNDQSINTSATETISSVATTSVPSPGSSDSGCSTASSNCTNSSSSNGPINTVAPFTVMISVEVLTIIDIHAHCVSNEVIGLLGGRYCPIFKQLHILIAEPCKSISASTTDLQCEMDPVSQSEAASRIFNSNNFVVGWYHSHPTFVPSPSLRDLETQGNYQEMFRHESNIPFIAIILSPYSGPCNPRHKHTLVSKFKCLMLSDQINPQVRHSAGTCYNYSISIKLRMLNETSLQPVSTLI